MIRNRPMVTNAPSTARRISFTRGMAMYTGSLELGAVQDRMDTDLGTGGRKIDGYCTDTSTAPNL